MADRGWRRHIVAAAWVAAGLGLGGLGMAGAMHAADRLATRAAAYARPAIGEATSGRLRRELAEDGRPLPAATLATAESERGTR